MVYLYSWSLIHSHSLTRSLTVWFGSDPGSVPKSAGVGLMAGEHSSCQSSSVRRSSFNVFGWFNCRSTVWFSGDDDDDDDGRTNEPTKGKCIVRISKKNHNVQLDDA